MIIQASSIGMHSSRTYKQTATSAFALTALSSTTPNQTDSPIDGLLNGKNSGGSLFQNQMDSLIQHYEQSRGVHAVSAKEEFRSLRQIQYESLNYLMQMLFHHGVVSTENMNWSTLTDTVAPSSQLALYESYDSYEESESTSFETTGTVITADGQEISFGLSVSMSRTFSESTYASALTNIPTCDPLVINLDTNVANVSDQHFMFDLDVDGQLDNISQLASGSGFLALDKNGDGKINDGSELFGTKSGDGFKDLAAYDSDGNGWIDEADEVFDKLLIWTKDADGKDMLCGLGAAGVGAIYLGNVSTNFSLNHAETNETNALIRKTGLFLYENGAAGTVQHVDLVKHEGIAQEA